MNAVDYQPFAIPRGGALLRGAVWGQGPCVVLAAHGITANHWSYQPLAQRLGPEYRLVALDLRGRGGSHDIQGPWGIQHHADDLIAVLDHLQLPRADVLVGHSMGAFVSAVAAAQYGERFGATLFIDGGLPIVERIPWFMPVPLFLRLMLGPSMKRLDMRFASRQAYLDYWRPHPSLQSDWNDEIERYVMADLIGEAPELRSGTVKAAVVGDARSMLDGQLLQNALRQLRLPVRFLRAPRGILNGKPLYRESHLARWAPQIPQFSSTLVPNVNHYTILMAPHGASAVAEEIKALAAVTAKNHSSQ